MSLKIYLNFQKKKKTVKKRYEVPINLGGFHESGPWILSSHEDIVSATLCRSRLQAVNESSLQASRGQRSTRVFPDASKKQRNNDNKIFHNQFPNVSFNNHHLKILNNEIAFLKAHIPKGAYILLRRCSNARSVIKLTATAMMPAS